MELVKFVLLYVISVAAYPEADASLPPSTSTEQDESLEEKLLHSIVYISDENDTPMGPGIFVEWGPNKTILVNENYVPESNDIKIEYYVNGIKKRGKAYMYRNFAGFMQLVFAQDGMSYGEGEMKFAKVYNTYLCTQEWKVPPEEIIALKYIKGTFRPIRLKGVTRVVATMVKTTRQVILGRGDFLFYEDQALAVLVGNTTKEYTYNTLAFVMRNLKVY